MAGPSGPAFLFNFYPRSPCGERPRKGFAMRWNTCISIHALLAESDFPPTWTLTTRKIFLSTLSLRRATAEIAKTSNADTNFYPRSPCGERPPRGGSCYLDNIISIHALLAESDHYDNYNLHCVEISIHALLAESDFGPISAGFIGGLFLSTLSLRRATSGHCEQSKSKTHFYPRSPCGERRRAKISESQYKHFYPRSPCGERRFKL